MEHISVATISWWNMIMILFALLLQLLMAIIKGVCIGINNNNQIGISPATYGL